MAGTFLPDRVQVLTKGKLNRLNGTASPDVIARTSSNLLFCKGQPGLVLFDFDSKSASSPVSPRMEELDGAGWHHSIITASCG